MICKYCGSVISKKSVFCSQCGRKLSNARTTSNPVQNYREAEYNDMLEFQAMKEQLLLADGLMKLSGQEGIISDEIIDDWGWLFF